MLEIASTRLTDRPLRLATIAMLLIAGAFAGAQLGKIAPLMGWYQDTLGFSLVLSGWLTAAIGLFVALAALPAGWAIDRVGMRRTVFVGSLALALGGLALAWLQAPEAILAARLVEGLGYVVLVIAIPAVLDAISPQGWRAPVLAIWSCFVPVGFAISDLAGGWLIPAAGPETFLLVMMLGYAVSIGLAMLMLAAVPDVPKAGAAEAGKAGSGARFRATLTLPVILVAACFGVWVVMTVSFFTFMPTFVAGEGSGMLVSAGVIALTVPIGNFAAAAVLPGRSARFAMALGIAGLAITALLAFPAFGAAPWPMTLSAAAVAIVGGVTGSMLYAVLPSLVPPNGSVAIGIGVVAQAGGIGTLIGPPLAGYVIQQAGWDGFTVFLAATAVLSMLIVLPLLRR